VENNQVQVNCQSTVEKLTKATPKKERVDRRTNQESKECLMTNVKLWSKCCKKPTD
jgi:hypothetical protein